MTRDLQVINSSGELTEIKLGGTTSGYALLTADEIATLMSTSYVPYTGSTADVDLGANNIDANNIPGYNHGLITSLSDTPTGDERVGDYYVPTISGALTNFGGIGAVIGKRVTKVSEPNTWGITTGAQFSEVSVPYSGAISSVNLGNNSLTSKFLQGFGDSTAEEDGKIVLKKYNAIEAITGVIVVRPNDLEHTTLATDLQLPIDDGTLATQEYIATTSVPYTGATGDVSLGENKLLVQEAILFSGTTGATPTSGAGTRMMWIPAKSAFRAGIVNGTQWDDANIGINSFAVGYVTEASGDYSTAMGSETTAMGRYTTAMGEYTKAESMSSVAIGRYNIGGGTAASWVETDPIFEIGIGASNVARANAMTVLKNGTSQFGNVTAGNYLEIDATGQVRLYGDATQWEDLRVPVVATTAAGSNDPSFQKIIDNGSASQGVFSYRFDPSTEEELYFTVQLPHSWKQGSDIEAHVHWIPITDGTEGKDVCWGLEYTWASIGEVFGNTTIIYGDVNHLGETLVANKHYLTELGAIDATDKTFSSMLMCRVFRDATSSGGTDDYTADAALLEIDFHYQIDSLGSNEEYVKY